MRVEFDVGALEDLTYWVKNDRKKALRILKLIREISRNTDSGGNVDSGTGKPEPLKHGLAGYWSRRIDRENRLVYRWDDEVVHIISCRYHYE
jgi:toxin YoeB